jgi:hypothetical protein
LSRTCLTSDFEKDKTKEILSATGVITNQKHRSMPLSSIVFADEDDITEDGVDYGDGTGIQKQVVTTKLLEIPIKHSATSPTLGAELLRVIQEHRECRDRLVGLV